MDRVARTAAAVFERAPELEVLSAELDRAHSGRAAAY
jgi:hypothetical protein